MLNRPVSVNSEKQVTLHSICIILGLLAKHKFWRKRYLQFLFSVWTKLFKLLHGTNFAWVTLRNWLLEGTMRIHVATAAIGIAGLFWAGSANAGVLNATNFSGATPLYTLDQTTGTATAVGGVLTDIGDLTSSGSTLWGVTLLNSNDLLQIDPLTGNPLNSVAITGARAAITSIAYDPVSGVLFGNTTVGFGDAADTLYSIDPLTGVATFIGAINFTDVFALGFDQNGDLFGISDLLDQFIEIDTATGAGALIAGIDFGSVYDIASRPEDNVMFALDSGTTSLYTLDPFGSFTLVGPWAGPGNLAGLAFTTAVPEPGTLGLILFGLLGLAGARRRLSL